MCVWCEGGGCVGSVEYEVVDELGASMVGLPFSFYSWEFEARQLPACCMLAWGVELLTLHFLI